jgi:hypothetical protein
MNKDWQPVKCIAPLQSMSGTKNKNGSGSDP